MKLNQDRQQAIHSGGLEYFSGRLRLKVQAAADLVRQSAGQSFDWCLDVVALRLAKFYEQRLAVETVMKVNGMLRRLQQ